MVLFPDLRGQSVLGPHFCCISTIWLICNCLRALNWLHMQMIYYWYKPVESNADYNQVQEDVTTIDHWMSRNFLTLNATKCKQMVITKSRTHQCPQLYLASQPLECVQSYKYLGVIITSNLSWLEYIQFICNKNRKFVPWTYSTASFT